MTVESKPTLLHSCAQAATASEVRFRVEYPNSRPRTSRIIALDDEAARIMASVAEAPWCGAHFFTLEEEDGGGEDLRLTRRDGKRCRLSEEVEGADVIVMLSTTSEGRRAAQIIGEMAKRRSIMTAGLALGDGTGARVADDVVNAFRPYVSVLVVAADADYVPAMLTALRA